MAKRILTPLPKTVKETVDFIYEFLIVHPDGVQFSAASLGGSTQKRILSILVKRGIIERTFLLTGKTGRVCKYKWIATMSPTKTLYGSIVTEIRNEQNAWPSHKKGAKSKQSVKEQPIVVDEPSIVTQETPAVIAHNALFPQYADRNLGDMTKIDWEKVPDFDLLFYSTPCQSISNAGLQHGFTEGSGTRSSIIWNVRDAVKIKRPKYLVLENVKAMISDKFVGMFNLWQSELLKFGYTNFPQVLNAKDYGVPQNRERIFLVSVHGDAWFNFPQPQELKLRLKDVLEENVDEKYYLDDVKVATFVGGLEKDKLNMICSD